MLDDSLEDQCIDSFDYKVNNYKSVAYDSSEDFESDLTVTADLSASGWGASVKASATYKTATQSAKSSVGVHMHWSQQSFALSLQASCRNGGKANPRFQAAWDNLPTTCDTEETCADYFRFTQ